MERSQILNVSKSAEINFVNADVIHISSVMGWGHFDIMGSVSAYLSHYIKSW